MRRLRLAILLTLACLMPTALLAHSCAKGVVKERMEVMKSMGEAMKNMGKMARGKIPLDSAKVAKSAGDIAGHGRRLTTLFPKGTGLGVSEASPEIWVDPEGFRKSADRLIQAANTLQSAAETNDRVAIRRSFRALGKTCGGCHKQYRIKKKKRRSP